MSEITFETLDGKTLQPLGDVLLSSTGGPGDWKAMSDEHGICKPNLAAADYTITFSKAGYATRILPVHIDGPGPSIRVGLDSLQRRLYADGGTIRDGAGRPHLIRGCTDLMLAWRYDVEGADAIRPVLAQRKQVGANNLRVLWQDFNNIGQAWQLPLSKLRPFLSLSAEYGFWIQGCILADCQFINKDTSAQQQRVADVRAETAGIDNHIEQLGNEYDKNGFDPRQFSRPTDRFACNASNIEGGPDAPYWDFFTFSGQRSPLNHAIREYGPLEFIYGDTGTYPHGPMPAICDEGMKPGKDSFDPEDYRRAGAQAKSGNGGRFHSEAGTKGNSCLFNELEFNCAVAFFEGMS